MKARLYSRAAIAEFWLLLTQEGALEVNRLPGPDGYTEVTRLDGEAAVSPLAVPDVWFAVADFFA